MNYKKIVLTPAVAAFLMAGIAGGGLNSAYAQEAAVASLAQSPVKITGAKKLNATTVELQLTDQKKMLLDFYGDHIFRLFRDDSGEGMRSPHAEPEAEILVPQPRKSLGALEVTDQNGVIRIETPEIKVEFNKETTLFTLTNLKTGKVVTRSVEPVELDPAKTTITLAEGADEYFFGGGVQNGRFSHKGEQIAIENKNSWTDGGVASPTPFYWSTAGYGMMWYTFKKGRYDFGRTQENRVSLSHDTTYLDVFLMVNEKPDALLRDFYQLTGNPVLIPKFGFYEGHLNAYNRDYWKENEEKGILFEDGKKYAESQKDNGGVQESLNGEKNNYQFSARAVVDRYLDNDLPLGWVLPNDGYGAGYGQTETLDGNIANLRSFGDYARSRGVEIGLWTQSDLHPKEGISALLQRDIVKEVRDAGVRVLKTDVAWVGAGYSFGLNGVADVGTIMPEYGQNARPFIITLDGWAGTQRYAGVWSGDQTGGLWEYIRFHIPTYIGSGLSGQPNITSDMDGIFGGKKPIINIRDFQWKTFTPMELNMDGWGSNPKYPQALGEPATSINRNYLKLKSELLPYAYTIAHESVTGLPQIRAMFLEDPNDFTLAKNTAYQFLYGPYFLVAPIYQETQADEQGNDIRNSIYLPKGKWVDYFTGEQYEGGRIINNVPAPIWKLPVFVKRGAVIPMHNPNNNPKEIRKDLRIYDIYPEGSTSFTEYDDDGTTEEYRTGKSAWTQINSDLDKKGNLRIAIAPTTGTYRGIVREKTTEIRLNVTQRPKKLSAVIGGKKIKLQEVNSRLALHNGQNVFFYDAKPDFNQFPTKGDAFEQVKIIKNPQVVVKLAPVDVTRTAIQLEAKGFVFAPEDHLLKNTGSLAAPSQIHLNEAQSSAYTLTPEWAPVSNADYYEIEFKGQLYSTITDHALLFDLLEPETSYDFKIRAVNKSGVSDWADFSAKTQSDPLKFAVKDLTGTSSAVHEPGSSIRNLFDRDPGTMWHTKWGESVSKFDVVVNLHSINQLDKLQYVPRDSGSNGNLLKGKVYYSNDQQNWTEAGDFDWKNDSTDKFFTFKDHPTARFVKLQVEKGVGDFGSGRELYVFKVPNTESIIPGDINDDKLVDENDLTSYLNYTGLKLGDADFEGYVSKGDVNQNGRIDAYDISVVATRLKGGAGWQVQNPLAGNLTLKADKANYKAGETIRITVSGKDLVSVNALGFALPYNEADMEYQGVDLLNMEQMENFTKDRLHTSSEKVLYPTFVNVGKQAELEGSKDLFIIRMKAKKNLKFVPQLKEGIIVDKRLNSKNL